MSDTNIVVLKGRLARSAELRTLTNGTPCTSFVLAVGESRKDSSTGVWENVPHFFDVTTFSNYAKAAIASLTQGQEVLVTGRLQQNRWEKNGQKFFGVRVLAHELEILRAPKSAGQAQQPQQAPQPQQTMPPPPSDAPNFAGASPDEFPDEIPY